MANAFINGAGCISAQKSFDGIFSEALALDETLNVLPVAEPSYGDYIASSASRRMSKGVKNATVAAALAMREAGLDTPDAIITGTGIGCIADSDKFLDAIIADNEQFLTPTSFIQSTHNTFGASIALGLKCKVYNFNYVQAAVSFESALLDTLMMLEEKTAYSILTGGVDELNDRTVALFKLAGFIKQDWEGHYCVLGSRTTGAVFSQGATFFVIEDRQRDSTYAKLLDVKLVNRLSVDEVEMAAHVFLKANNLKVSDVDAVVLGLNGDTAYDMYYQELTDKTFAAIPQVYYKHLSGEYNTASAFGLWIAANVIREQRIPGILQVNDLSKTEYRNILLYNQYRGADHSFTLISR
ncbi:MAG: 3-oxoacyl-ACP synthase [Chitinophagaceae bacterium]|nr:MAG: 3-oxoacyl-ACP synthase [Chitinophagaceae bacterium]